MGPSLCLWSVSASVRDAEISGGCGSGVFIGVEIDGEGGEDQEVPQRLT